MQLGVKIVKMYAVWCVYAGVGAGTGKETDTLVKNQAWSPLQKKTAFVERQKQNPL